MVCLRGRSSGTPARVCRGLRGDAPSVTIRMCIGYVNVSDTESYRVGWPVTETREAPRSARRDATRERVLDAARDVFADRGVNGATVEEICDRAGFTRGAFYSNFDDKADVLEALIEREHARLLAHLDATMALAEGGGLVLDVDTAP